MITLNFDKLYSTPRTAEPCFISIPFPQGALKDTSCLSLTQEDTKMPFQAKATAFHKDGSIKYLFMRFLANLPANQKTSLSLSLEKNATQEESLSPMLFTKTTGFCVSTGALSFAVKNDSKHLFSFVEAFGQHYAEDAFCGPFVETTSNERYLAQFHTWRVVETGDIATILACDASLLPADTQDSSQTALGCEVLLTAYRNKPWVEVSFRLINTTPAALLLSSYTFLVQGNGNETTSIPRTCVASSNYRTDYVFGEQGETVRKEITADSLINQSNEHYAEVFYGTFFADWTTTQGGICATVFQAAQNFPKAIEASNNGITIHLIPKQVQNSSEKTSLTMQSGMAREQKFLLHFHDSEEPFTALNDRSTIYQMPDRPFLDSSVYEDANVFLDIFVHEKDSLAECALVQCADAHARAYGMFNWGDAPDPNYSAQGRGHGRPVWTNNEYDFPHACMLLYAKTGIRRFMDYALVAGMHQIDVDICHYSDDPLLLGGQWEHTHGHTVEGYMVCSHQWVEGILDCYHLTGDERFLQSALGIGENILRLLDTPMYQKEGSFNARETGWALRSLTALYTETYDEKWTAKSNWIVNQFQEWEQHYGGWMAPYLDNVVIRVPFMISVAVGSLMRYYREFPKDDIKTMLLHAVDDLIENCMLDNGFFFYKELPSLNRIGNNPLVLEALAIAYELTLDTKYLTAGLKTYQAVLENMLHSGGGGKRIVEDAVLVGSTGTKQFAQTMIPVASFYKALEKAKL